MPPSSLLDNLNSDYLAAFSALMPKKSAIRVLVYVESHEDIAFWQDILSPFEGNKISFDIQLPVQNALEQGKTAVLTFANRTGKNLILCVDSDYDYLLQRTTQTSALINGNVYIFHTYAYSIENLRSYAPSLHKICVQATKKDEKKVDFEALLALYSTIVYPLFLWSLYFYKKRDTESFTITDFSDTIKILQTPSLSDNFFSSLEELRTRIIQKIKELENTFPQEITSVKVLAEELKELGVEQTNTYLFAQGHTIKNNVVLMFLKSVYSALKSENEHFIKTNAKNQEEMVNQRNHYKNQLIDIETVLDLNTNFKSCFLYQKIEADLQQYLQLFD